jgi:hypothetical protein
VEGLEDRRLLSGSADVLRLASPLVEAGVAQATHSSGVAVTESQPKLGNEGENSSGVATEINQQSASKLGNDSGAAKAGVSAAGGDNNVADPAESASAASAGRAESTPLSAGATSPGPASLPLSQSAGRGFVSVPGQQAEDDEASAASQDPAAREEPTGIARGGAPLVSAGAGTAGDAAAPLSSSPAPVSAPISLGGVVWEPSAREADAGCGAKGAAPVAASSDGEIVAPAETTISATGFVLRGRFARGTWSQTDLAFDDPAASVEDVPGPCHAGLVSEFLLLDRAALDRAIDRFLDQFESIAAELTHFDASSTLLATASAAALTALASGVVVQRRRSWSDGANAPAEGREEEFKHFSGLPNSWNWGLAGT